MKVAIIALSQITAANRMDAGFHLAKKANEETEQRLRKSLTKEEAAAIVQHVLDNGPKLMLQKLQPYARGSSPQRRLNEIPSDHPYEAAAMIVNSKNEIETALDEEVAAVDAKRQGFQSLFSTIPDKSESE